MIARKPQKEAQAAKFIAAGAGNGRAAPSKLCSHHHQL
jgi:hypothetical protein